MESIHRANGYTIGIFTIYAVLGHDIGHTFLQKEFKYLKKLSLKE